MKSNELILADFGAMPAYMGCVSSDAETDKFYPMRWSINSQGFLSVMNPPPLNEVYLDQHSEPTASRLWVDHHETFADFLLAGLEGRHVLEIGGGSGLLASIALEKSEESLSWQIVEPFLPAKKPPGIEWIEGWFPEDIPAKQGGVLVATHVLEHSTNPQAFINSCAKYLDEGDVMFLSWPDMTEMAKRGDLNMLNFEHLTFLPLETVRVMLAIAGFEVENLVKFRGHSIFIRCRVAPQCSNPRGKGRQNAEELATLATRYSDLLDQRVAAMNDLIEHWDGEVSLFGAHIFSQYLIARGLKIGKVTRLLDNAKHKEGLRLYGTTLQVANPEAIRGSASQLILVATALYENEILEQLRGLEMSNAVAYLSSLGVCNIA